MSRYMAEVYVPRVDDLPAVTTQVHSAARAVSREGTPIRHLRSILVPEDETCLLLFEAASATAVQEATRRAGLDVTRVVEAVEPASLR